MKIKIAVVVGADGTWSSVGWDHAENSLMDAAMEGMMEYTNIKKYWVEAEVEPPTEEVETVVGEVTDV